MRYLSNQKIRHSRTRAGLGVSLGAAALVLALTGCSNSIPSKTTDSEPSAQQQENQTVTLVTYDSFPLSEETTQTFRKETGYELKVVKAGDGVELANKIVLRGDAPLGDAVFGVDNNAAGDLDKAGVIMPLGVKLPPSVAQHQPENSNLIPVDKGEVCLNYDIAYFESKDLRPPSGFADLLDSKYRGLTVVEDPRTSTPGLAFLLATIADQGEDSWLDYWKKLRENGVKVASSWDDAFNSDFTAGSNENDSANYPIMVSYASSPAWAVSEDGSSTTIGNVGATCYAQVEYAGVLKGAQNLQGAKALVEFLIGETAQSDLTQNNYMYPVLDSVPLPEALAKFGAPSGQAASIEQSKVSAHREAWVRSWAEIMGQ